MPVSNVTPSSLTLPMDVVDRAFQSHGTSDRAVYQMVARSLTEHHHDRGILIDVGCGAGQLWPFLKKQFDYYIGVDVVYYENFPKGAEFIRYDLDKGKTLLTDNVGDVVCAVETIEHLENPRAFVRELVRLTKPGGMVVVTTPNQLSLLSKLTLVFKDEFNAFQEAPGLYPSHITALLEIDLIRIFSECGLEDIKIVYSNQGRVPFTSQHWSRKLGFSGRLFSDNILCIGRKLKS